MKKTPMNPSDIMLRPSINYWVITNCHLIVISVIILLFSNFLKINEALQYAGSLLALGILLVLFYRYINTLLCTKWIITKEQILIYKGVFAKSIDYIELYRVCDYQERKSFIQALINNTNLYIYSGDKSNPVLAIKGIKAGTNILKEIRERVETQKQRKSIYEFTNR